MKNRLHIHRGQLEILLPLLVLLMGIAAMWMAPHFVQQAASPILMTQSFQGEYSRDGETWKPLTPHDKLSALDGDLYLRGTLENTVLAGTSLFFFSDHIGKELYIDGEFATADIIMEMDRYGIELQPAMCSRGWQSWYFEETLPQGTPVEIRLTNPHRFGNSNAYVDFLQSLCCSVEDTAYLEAALEPHSRPGIIMGVVSLLAAVMLLGSALAAEALRVSFGLMLSKIGLLAGFAGGFFLLDTVNVSLWSENNILNTYGWQISMMYAVYLIGLLARDSLSGKRKKMASLAMLVSALFDMVIVILSFTGVTLIYDTLGWWAMSQFLLCPVMIVCCIMELGPQRRDRNISVWFFLILFFCIPADLLGLFGSMYSHGNLSKTVILVFFVYTFLRSARSIILDHKASARAQTLEKELEESRIAVMLSQIQPHFMFNVLGTLRGLCREDPEQAWQGLGDFSAYLRGNMNALTNTRTIPFDRELHHVETYLRLEKMRLGDKLSIVYDIRERDFLIPPLTVQPLVENAVKHGIFYKQNGGTVIIHSRLEENRVVIMVQDNGVGMENHNPEPAFENHTHIGLSNVRKRVEKMLGGTLQIQSSPEQGTTVTVTFPVPEAVEEGVKSDEYIGSR